MSIAITYACGGCHERTVAPVVRSALPICKSVQRFDLEGGLCLQYWPGVIDSLPPGWGICVSGCVYCPTCLAEVNGATMPTGQEAAP